MFTPSTLLNVAWEALQAHFQSLKLTFWYFISLSVTITFVSVHHTCTVYWWNLLTKLASFNWQRSTSPSLTTDITAANTEA